jgi:hypothetical protein
MTLALRTPAELLRPDSSERIASGIAIIWADPQQWGGIFDPLDNAEQLRAATAAQPLTAQLKLADGRQIIITLSPSEFVADDVRPLTFRGQSQLDSAAFRAFTDETGVRQNMNQ